MPFQPFPGQPWINLARPAPRILWELVEPGGGDELREVAVALLRFGQQGEGIATFRCYFRAEDGVQFRLLGGLPEAYRARERIMVGEGESGKAEGFGRCNQVFG